MATEYNPEIIVRLDADTHPEITLTGRIDDLIALSVALIAYLATAHTDDPVLNIRAMAATAILLAEQMEDTSDED